MLTHIALTHSLFKYAGSINGPGYTLGYEWQLYFFMVPFLIAVRRIGWAGLFAIIILIALFPHPLVQKSVGRFLSPTFTLPFLLGMYGVRLLRRLPTDIPSAKRQRQIATLIVVASLIGQCILEPINRLMACWLVASATGAACFYMARVPHSLWTRCFSLPLFQFLGTFSYSLYLVHFPLLALLHYMATHFGLHGKTAFYVVYLPGTLFIFCFAYLFFHLFEKPFMASRPTSAKAASQTG